ncbi:adenylate/guanylate cyclase domain-containing protein [Aureimonas sp. SA4125]|uniref:CHASE2 domain-containing protein n=1 Tax=Aureimonas sp. SA4125 TaxID=2826993 RepID=UPI001CC7C0CB|nr:adenylate/guanylate cyclase domain-containing protein [Aureimonas sp. SA4125]
MATLAWVAWLGGQHLRGERSPADVLEEPLTDWRTLLAGPVTPPGTVAIVAIDDATVAAEGGYPLDWRRLAGLLDALRAAGAQTLAIDILFVDPQAATSAAALARALSAGPTVIAAAGRFAKEGKGTAGAPLVIDQLRPLRAFEKVADVGLANVATTVGGTPRHLPLLFMGEAGPVPGFALQAAALRQSADPILAENRVQIGDVSIPLDLNWHLPIRFYGPAGSIRTISASTFLSGEDNAPRLDGMIAVVGVTATAIGDTFGTPFDPATPGVEVQATGIAELLGGPRLVRNDVVRQTDVAMAMALATGGTVLALCLPLTQSLPIMVLGLTIVLAGTAVAFSSGIWMSSGLPLVATVPPFAAAAFRRQIGDRRTARAAADAETELRRFQPAAIAERIAHDPSFLQEPVEQHAAVVFIDIAGFSTRSEAIGPVRTQNLLKGFHTLVVDVVESHGGLVLNFMGDGAMMVFGALDTAPDPAGRAFRAGAELSSRAIEWLEHLARDGHGLSVRVGMHFGPVILSRLGHRDHQQISVSGNTVNLASRLMEVAKLEGAVLAASASLLNAVEPSRVLANPPDMLRPVDIRGLREKVIVGLWIEAAR